MITERELFKGIAAQLKLLQANGVTSKKDVPKEILDIYFSYGTPKGIKLINKLRGKK